MTETRSESILALIVFVAFVTLIVSAPIWAPALDQWLETPAVWKCP